MKNATYNDNTRKPSIPRQHRGSKSVCRTLSQFAPLPVKFATTSSSVGVVGLGSPSCETHCTTSIPPITSTTALRAPIAKHSSPRCGLDGHRHNSDSQREFRPTVACPSGDGKSSGSSLVQPNSISVPRRPSSGVVVIAVELACMITNKKKAPANKHRR